EYEIFGGAEILCLQPLQHLDRQVQVAAAIGGGKPPRFAGRAQARSDRTAGSFETMFRDGLCSGRGPLRLRSGKQLLGFLMFNHGPGRSRIVPARNWGTGPAGGWNNWWPCPCHQDGWR